MNSPEPKKRPSLEQVLAYQNPKVVGSFLRSIEMSEVEAHELFEQTKKLLWLANEMEFDLMRDNERMFTIDDSLFIIDEMWHTFILFTEEYSKFCRELFGYVLHHLPTVESEEEKLAKAAEFEGLSKDQAIAKMMDEKRWQYNYVFNKLGQETFVKWYVEYHKKFTPLHVAELKFNKVKNKYAVAEKQAIAA